MQLDELLALSNNEREQKYRDAPKNVLVQYLNEVCTETNRLRAIIKNYNPTQTSNRTPDHPHIYEKIRLSMESEPERPGEEQDDMPPELELDEEEDDKY